jgi:hypothetical protein
MSPSRGANAKRHARRTIDSLARSGFLGQGVVYIALGGLALRAASGAAAVPDTPLDALRMLTVAPPGGTRAEGELLGALPLAVIVLGAFGFAVWQVVAAVTDAGGEGAGPWGLVRRLGRLLGAFIYGALALAIVRMLAEPVRARQQDVVPRYTAEVMARPHGTWLVALVGLGIMAYGVWELIRAGRERVDERLDMRGTRLAARHWAERIGRLGLVAHGLVFGLIGSFLLRAALVRDPRQAAGVGGALRALWSAGDRPWFLGVAALGLVAFGFYQLAHACYRRVETP